MAISAQDKILYVANKLGLSTLKNMQGSTGAVYDTDTNVSGVLFGNASQHVFPTDTNISDNKFEVNSALLIETIAFYFNNEGNNGNLLDLGTMVGTDMLIFDLIIGNKVVMKDTPIFVGGGPSTFATMGSVFDSGPGVTVSVPRHQIFLEGAGILIPPQVEWSINYSAYSWATGVKTDLTTIPGIAAYLFGTRVLLNFNTSI